MQVEFKSLTPANMVVADPNTRTRGQSYSRVKLTGQLFRSEEGEALLLGYGDEAPTQKNILQQYEFDDKIVILKKYIIFSSKYMTKTSFDENSNSTS